MSVEEIKEKNAQAGSRINGQEVDGSHLTAGGVGLETVKVIIDPVSLPFCMFQFICL